MRSVDHLDMQEVDRQALADHDGCDVVTVGGVELELAHAAGNRRWSREMAFPVFSSKPNRSLVPSRTMKSTSGRFVAEAVGGAAEARACPY